MRPPTRRGDCRRVRSRCAGSWRPVSWRPVWWRPVCWRPVSWGPTPWWVTFRRVGSGPVMSLLP
ncbi:hypothetical protein EKE94_14060 [Mesobaculum littorinae]|uniref:Uncharacterized protein n=1 Tax=Mesobaculum littorinae TaxID=2486419 RepID=A0A438AG13_9RHOB|nr:hypothetical protein EKE94_14060 [Mesobaculum littorinae]